MARPLRIEPSGYILGAVCLYLLPFRWVVGAVTAAAVHEIFHLLALIFTGGSMYGIILRGFGAEIETGPLERKQELVCALAGPLGSFFTLTLSSFFPEAALCGLVHGLYNLLPLYPMDGGRVFGCLLPEKLFVWVERITILLLLAFGCRFPWLMFPVAVTVACRYRKFPCKAVKKAVQ